MKKIFLSFLAVLLLVPTLAFAGTFRAGEQVMLAEPINDDLYASGSVVQIDKDVNGDVMVAGAKISVDSKVSQDLTLAGGNIDVRGEVGDDARLAGGNVTVGATIKDDLMLAGGNLELTKSSFIGSDLMFGGGNVILNGVVAGNVIATGGNIYINGEVKGLVKLYRIEKLVFGPNAKIGGDLTYSSKKEVKIADGVVGGKVTYNPIKKQMGERHMEWAFAGMVAGFSIYSLLATLFFGLFLIWIYKWFTFHVAATVYKEPLKTLGIGFLVFIGMPIAALLFLITAIGLPVSMVLMASWVLALYFSKIMAAMVIGWKIVKLKDQDSFGKAYGGFAVGALFYTLLCLVPVIGWIIKDLFVLMALGAIAMYKVNTLRLLRAKKLA